MLLLAAIVGLVTGLLVAGFEWVVVDQAIPRVLDAPLWVRAVAPGLGLVLAAIVLRLGGGLSPSTSDEYIKNFHDHRDLSTFDRSSGGSQPRSPRWGPEIPVGWKGRRSTSVPASAP